VSVREGVSEGVGVHVAVECGGVGVGVEVFLRERESVCVCGRGRGQGRLGQTITGAPTQSSCHDKYNSTDLPRRFLL
jgi:hypothetical protein